MDLDYFGSFATILSIVKLILPLPRIKKLLNALGFSGLNAKIDSCGYHACSMGYRFLKPRIPMLMI